jgi:hypothetical protein
MKKTVTAFSAGLLASFALAGASLAQGDSSGQTSTGAMASHDSTSSDSMSHGAMSTDAMAAHDSTSTGSKGASDHMAKGQKHKTGHHAAMAHGAMPKQP